ncbi:hypothetical protein [Bacteroides fragilis]
MADKRLNEFPLVNNLSKLLGLDYNGNGVQMTPTSLLDNLFQDRGGFDYNDSSIVNSLINPGTYLHGDRIIDTDGGYGILIVFKSSSYVAQADFVNHGKILFRFSYDLGIHWNSWKTISFT